MATGVLDWSKKGDYRQPPPGIFFNFADPAARKQKRDLMFGARAQGASALGGADSTLLALDKQHRDDEWAADSARQHEADVSEGVGRAAAVTGDLAQLDQSRRMGILGTTAGLFNSQLERDSRKVSWWEKLMMGARANAESAAQSASMGG